MVVEKESDNTNSLKLLHGMLDFKRIFKRLVLERDPANHLLGRSNS